MIVKLENDLHHFGMPLSEIKSYKNSSSESDIEGTFMVPSLDVRAQVPNIYDRRNGFGKHVFKLAPPGHDQNVRYHCSSCV